MKSIDTTLNWRDVNEELPNKNVKCLVKITNGKDDSILKEAIFSVKHQYWQFTRMTDKVTYWLPFDEINQP